MVEFFDVKGMWVVILKIFLYIFKYGIIFFFKLILIKLKNDKGDI